MSCKRLFSLRAKNKRLSSLYRGCIRKWMHPLFYDLIPICSANDITLFIHSFPLLHPAFLHPIAVAIACMHTAPQLCQQSAKSQTTVTCQRRRILLLQGGVKGGGGHDARSLLTGRANWKLAPSTSSAGVTR